MSLPLPVPGVPGDGVAEERGDGRVGETEEASPSFSVERREWGVEGGGGLLTWGNICCIEIETDDSSDVQSEGLSTLMGNGPVENETDSTCLTPESRPCVIQTLVKTHLTRQ